MKNEEILDKYKGQAGINEHIFLDGVVDKEEYGKCFPKILVILRAGYIEGDKNKMEKDFDLRDFLYNGAQGKGKKGTWRNFPEWYIVYVLKRFMKKMTWQLLLGK